MGMEDCFPWHTATDYCGWILKDTKMTFKEFKDIGILQGNMRYRKYEQAGFRTPSGKFELYCSALEQMGYDPLPYYIEPPESLYSLPDTYREYPLIITTGARIRTFFHTEGRQIEFLRRHNPDPEVEIQHDTAKALDINNNDWVWIESPRGGRIKQKARLTRGIHPRVVSAQYG